MTSQLIRLADLVSYEEAAVMIGQSRAKVLALSKRGQLESIRLGPKCVKFRRADVERYVARVLRTRDGNDATN